MSILNQMKAKSKYHSSDPTKMTTKRIIGKVNLMETVNAKMEDFVNLVFYKDNVYVLSFLGYTCIAKKFPVKIEGNAAPFEITVSIDVLRILSNKEFLTLELKDGKVIWTFMYGEGAMKRVMQPTSWRDNIKYYMDFIIDVEEGKGSRGGFINSGNLKFMNRIAKGIIRDERSRNIVLGNGYAYTITPTFVIYKKADISSDLILTEVVLSNLPRKNQNFYSRTYRGLQGLVSVDNELFYIIKEMGSNTDIFPYINNEIEWTAKLPEKIEDAINVVSFGETKPVELEFESNGVMRIIDTNKDNMFMSKSEVYVSRTEEISSAIRNFRKMSRIGRMYTPKAMLNVIEFEGGEICLMN